MNNQTRDKVKEIMSNASKGLGKIVAGPSLFIAESASFIYLLEKAERFVNLPYIQGELINVGLHSAYGAVALGTGILTANLLKSASQDFGHIEMLSSD